MTAKNRVYLMCVDSGGFSVSSGTLRVEDLLQAYGDFLGQWDEYDDLAFEARSLAHALNSKLPSPGVQDRALTVLAELVLPAMENLAPDGWYFGALEGDGSDFGYWQVTDDEF